MFFSMCFLIGTGLLMKYRLVPGYLGGHGLTLFGLSRHDWGAFHLWIAYLITLLIVIHLILNLSFIKNIVASKKPSILILLALVGISVILFFLLAPIEKIQKGGKGYGRRHSAKQANPYKASD